MKDLVLAGVSLAGPPFGVALGAFLTSMGGRRNEIKNLLEKAIADVAYAHAAHSIFTRSDLGGGSVAVERSAALTTRMHEEMVSSLILARAALARLTPFSTEFGSFARDINKIREEDSYALLMKLLDR